jgi:excisionase family DNA binding protein
MNKTPLRISELPIGRTKAYQEIKEGKLRAVKCGTLTLILPEDYDQWLKSLPPIVTKSAIDGGQR